MGERGVVKVGEVRGVVSNWLSSQSTHQRHLLRNSEIGLVVMIINDIC
jgi:hypothetical protein